MIKVSELNSDFLYVSTGTGLVQWGPDNSQRMRKNCANYPYIKVNGVNGKHTIVRIKQNVRIIQGHTIRALL